MVRFTIGQFARGHFPSGSRGLVLSRVGALVSRVWPGLGASHKRAFSAACVGGSRVSRVVSRTRATEKSLFFPKCLFFSHSARRSFNPDHPDQLSIQRVIAGSIRTTARVGPF